MSKTIKSKKVKILDRVNLTLKQVRDYPLQALSVECGSVIFFYNAIGKRIDCEMLIKLLTRTGKMETWAYLELFYSLLASELRMKSTFLLFAVLKFCRPCSV